MTSSSDKQRDCEFCDIALDLPSPHISHARFFGLIPTLQRTGLPSCYRKTIAAFEDTVFHMTMQRLGDIILARRIMDSVVVSWLRYYRSDVDLMYYAEAWPACCCMIDWV